MQALAAQGQSVISALLDPVSTPPEWQHYPDGDARDPAAGLRYFYHCHRDMPRAWGEHGHFHVFAEHCKRRPDGAADLTHLIGLSVDARGLPLRVFTTNRWVTGESWRPAAQVLALLDRFPITAQAGPPAVGTWLSALMLLLRPQIEHTLQARDARLKCMAAASSRPNLLDDRRIHVLSSQPVSLFDQVAALDACATELAA